MLFGSGGGNSAKAGAKGVEQDVVEPLDSVVGTGCCGGDHVSGCLVLARRLVGW